MPTADPSSATQHRVPRWVLLAVSTVLAIVLIAVILLAVYWPFLKSKVLSNIQEDFPGAVRAAKFHSTYFPHAGCVAEDIVVTPADGPPNTITHIYVHKLTVQTEYAGLFFRPTRISRVILEGLRVEILPSTAPKPPAPKVPRTPSSIYGEIVADNSVLEIGRSEGKSPLRFEIHKLTVHSVRDDAPLSYDVVMHNPEPSAEIRATGKFGPWNSSDHGKTFVSGNYSFDHADLGEFEGIAGILSSTGHFEGPLGHIATQGNTDIPNFEVTHAKHPIHLKTKFDAFVDGLNGDTFLKNVTATFLQTTVVASGSVAGEKNQHGKFTNLDFVAHDGHIQDLLRMFVKASDPPMDGVTNFHGHVTLPPGPEKFLQKVILEADFTISGGKLTNPERQAAVDELSKNARDKKKEKTTESVTSDTASHVVLRGGVAKFTDLSFAIPGATAKMEGTFNLENHKIDFHGPLKTEAELSHQTSGVKAVLLKPLDPLFKRKHAGADVPAEATGTFGHPHFGIQIIPKK
ncbi:MAG TPA: hypothetical protein VGI16_11165 [Candidatus Acidoferrum sp.]|jgi:hypothetical protein